MMADVGGELSKLAVELFFPFPDGFGEDRSSEGRVGVDITHGFELGDCLTCQHVC